MRPGGVEVECFDADPCKRGSVSQPPEIPGSRRLKRAAASAGSSAYQGVFEAVGSILIACVGGFISFSEFMEQPYTDRLEYSAWLRKQARDVERGEL